MSLENWGPFLFLAPMKYIDTCIKYLDVWHWSKDFTWREDEGWWIFGDWIQPPEETLKKQRGDCEDYALVIASWMVRNERPGAHLAWCWEGLWPPYPTHVIAYDDEQVYSSGTIYDSLDEFFEKTRWTHCVTRSL